MEQTTTSYKQQQSYLTCLNTSWLVLTPTLKEAREIPNPERNEDEYDVSIYLNDMCFYLTETESYSQPNNQATHSKTHAPRPTCQITKQPNLLILKVINQSIHTNSTD